MPRAENRKMPTNQLNSKQGIFEETNRMDHPHFSKQNQNEELFEKMTKQQLEKYIRNNMNVIPINRSYFQQPTIDLAPSLLGKLLVKETSAGLAAGWIVETEAYIGPIDRAAHSYGNRRTPRTEVMFGSPGNVYIYQMHTHCLINVVSGEVNHPEAILIRALEPYCGIQLMYERRGQDKKIQDLTNGPGKLTKALGIIKSDYGHPLFKRPLFIAKGEEKEFDQIATGPRIGIGNSGEAKDYPWRFWIDGNRFVSK